MKMTLNLLEAYARAQVTDEQRSAVRRYLMSSPEAMETMLKMIGDSYGRATDFVADAEIEVEDEVPFSPDKVHFSDSLNFCCSAAPMPNQVLHTSNCCASAPDLDDDDECLRPTPAKACRSRSGMIGKLLSKVSSLKSKKVPEPEPEAVIDSCCAYKSIDLHESMDFFFEEPAAPDQFLEERRKSVNQRLDDFIDELGI